MALKLAKALDAGTREPRYLWLVEKTFEFPPGINVLVKPPGYSVQNGQQWVPVTEAQYLRVDPQNVVAVPMSAQDVADNFIEYEGPALPFPLMTDYGDNRDLTGRSVVQPNSLSGPKVMVLAITGQSMWANYTLASVFAPGPNVLEFDIWTGKAYTSTGAPCLSCDGWPGRISIVPYLAQQIVDAGKATKVLICNLTMGGTSAQQWAPGGICNPKIGYLVRRLAAAGLPAPNVIVHVQGQADVNIDTPTAAYLARNQSYIATWRDLGITAPLLIGRGVFWNDISTIKVASAQAVRLGQVQSVSGPNVLMGPDDDAIGLTHRVDGVHWAEAGRFVTVANWLPYIPGM